MNKYFSVLLVLFFPFAGISQAPTFHAKWDQRYGGLMEDIISNFLITSDSGFVMGGTSYSGISGDKTEDNYDTSFVTGDFWIVKTDSMGVKIWDKRYGGNNSEIHLETIQTADGGYLSGGQSFSGAGGDKSQPNWDPTQGSNDYWIIKTDAQGVKQWDKRFGGTSFELLGSVRQTNDGGYIISGSSFSGISGDKTQVNQGSWDYWVVRTNSLGVKIWDRRFGGLDDDFATCMDRTADGGYIIGGYSKSDVGGDKTQPCQGNWDYWVVKINDQGNKVWDKTFGGNYTDWLFALTVTQDGGFLLGGQSFSEASGDKTEPNHDATPSGSDYWIVKINASGTKQWDRTFGASQIEDISRVVQTSEGGYMLSGESYSPADGDKTESNLGIEQTWVVKTDSAGIIEWDKTVFTLGHDEAGTAVPYDDDCFVVVNFTQADTGGYVTNMSRGVGDYLMVKLCKDDPLFVNEIDEINLINLFPNPVTTHLNIELKSTKEELIQIELLDVQGKIMLAKNVALSTQNNIIELDTRTLPSGVYFCKISDSAQVRYRKFVKVE